MNKIRILVRTEPYACVQLYDFKNTHDYRAMVVYSDRGWTGQWNAPASCPVDKFDRDYPINAPSPAGFGYRQYSHCKALKLMAQLRYQPDVIIKVRNILRGAVR